MTTFTDAVLKVNSLLSGGWTPANTDSITPTIDAIYNRKHVDLRDGDFILTFLIDNIPVSNAIGNDSKRTVDNVRVDVRTCTTMDQTNTEGRAHFIKMIGEVQRILEVNTIADATFDMIEIINFRDLSDKFKKLWRMLIDVKLTKTNEQRKV